MSENWYKIDNAGKIFPTIWSKKNRNGFRLSALLKEEVDKTILEEAVDEALKRFPMFKVRLRPGLFWYYFEQNNQKLIIREDSPIIFNYVHPYKNNGYLFSVNYYGKRISIDFFHALSDGTGGLEFLKSVVYYYLQFKGYEIENNGEVITNDFEKYSDESQDSFIKNYHIDALKQEKENKGVKLKGTLYGEGRLGIIHAQMDALKLKEVTKKYNATITEYLTSKILESLYINQYLKYNRKPTTKEVYNVLVAVNVRKYFDSKTLRNFALFIRTNTTFNESTTFETILESVKNVFNKELTKEKMLSRIQQNVKLEKNFFVRILPLFIKKQAMKIGYKILGSSIDTTDISNLGIAKLPNGAEKIVDRMEFVLTASKESPLNTAVITFNNKCVISFTTAILELDYIKTIIRSLVKDGMNVIVDSNDLEVK